MDERGFFSRTFDAAVMRAAGIDPAAFVQDSISRSGRGVLRGLHLRGGPGEAKLVRCSYGAIFDVIVDLRPASPTYRNWESFELRDSEQASLYIPAGCAHGFQALTDPADVSYRIDREHDPSQDVAIAHDDPEARDPVATARHGDVGSRPAGRTALICGFLPMSSSVCAILRLCLLLATRASMPGGYAPRHAGGGSRGAGCPTCRSSRKLKCR